MATLLGQIVLSNTYFKSSRDDGGRKTNEVKIK